MPNAMTIDWLLEEPVPPMPATPCVDLLIRCAHGHDALSLVTSVLAARRLSASSTRLRRARGNAFIEARIPRSDATAAEQIAGALSSEPGIRSVSYRTSGRACVRWHP